MPDNVNHPSHYNMGGIEVIDAIEAWGFGEGFNRGNAIKYIARAGRKDAGRTVEDLEKARFYIDREIERVRKGQDKTKVWPCDIEMEDLYDFLKLLNREPVRTFRPRDEREQT